MPFLAQGFHSSESKNAVKRAGIRSVVACQCLLDEGCSVFLFSKIQLVVHYQCYVLIG